MNHKPLIRIRRGLMSALVLAVTFGAVPASAIDWYPWLQGTPFASFEKDDMQLFLAASRKALNETPDNQTVHWENPRTGRRGEMLVMSTFEWQGRPCKQMRVTNEAGSGKATNVLYACRIENQWKLVTRSQLEK